MECHLLRLHVVHYRLNFSGNSSSAGRWFGRWIKERLNRIQRNKRRLQFNDTVKSDIGTQFNATSKSNTSHTYTGSDE